jgi:uncharacterized protein YcgL (UPF0745 family)
MQKKTRTRLEEKVGSANLSLKQRNDLLEVLKTLKRRNFQLQLSAQRNGKKNQVVAYVAAQNAIDEVAEVLEKYSY